MKNNVLLQGTAKTGARYAYNENGADYYTFTLITSRKSGVYDEIPVLVREQDADIIEGDALQVVGTFRSRNEYAENKRKLILFVYANTVTYKHDLHENRINVTGTIIKPPIYRHTPLGRVICDLLIAVNRKNGKADYIPCIAFGSDARRARSLSVGDNISLQGRFQSRLYEKDGETKTAYELCITKIEQV